MTNCGAPNCTNRPDADDCTNKTYHKLPAESRGEIRKKWLVNIKRQNVPKHLYICSDHFEPECYKKGFKVSSCFFLIIIYFFVIACKLEYANIQVISQLTITTP